MATRSIIAIEDPKEIRAIYCHWNGYLEDNGEVLFNYYNTEEKVRELIALGDLSTVYEHVKPPEGTVHSFDKPQPGVTIAYHRDRNDALNIETRYTRSGLATLAGNNDAEYVYLWTDGAWHVSTGKFKIYEKLTPEMVGITA